MQHILIIFFTSPNSFQNFFISLYTQLYDLPVSQNNQIKIGKPPKYENTKPKNNSKKYRK